MHFVYLVKLYSCCLLRAIVVECEQSASAEMKKKKEKPYFDERKRVLANIESITFEVDEFKWN